MKVKCSKCGKEVEVSDSLQGKLVEICKASRMIPIWKHPYDSFIKGWECHDHFIAEQQDIPSEFARVLNKMIKEL